MAVQSQPKQIFQETLSCKVHHKNSESRNEKGEIIKNTKEIQEIIRSFFENLHSNELENLEEMDTYDHPKLNQ
jgi:hypothetical protein